MRKAIVGSISFPHTMFRDLYDFCRLLSDSVRTLSPYLFSSDPTRPDQANIMELWWWPNCLSGPSPNCCINQMVVSKVSHQIAQFKLLSFFSSLSGTMISHPMATSGEDGDTRKHKAGECSSNKFFNLIEYLN
jgi:hypothetical protein